MAAKRLPRSWSVHEQLIDDDVSGLTLRFETSEDGEPVLSVYGAALPHGNRVFQFSRNGPLRSMATSALWNLQQRFDGCIGKDQRGRVTIPKGQTPRAIAMAAGRQRDAFARLAKRRYGGT